MKIITKESAAWREAARQIGEGQLTRGLCLMLFRMANDGVISDTLRLAMQERIYAAAREGGYCDGWHIWPKGEPNERILYCLFMALLAEDEGN